MKDTDIKVLILKHFDDAKGFAKACCKNVPTQWEEIFHEACARIFSGDATCRDPQYFRSFFFGVIKNTALEIQRKNRTHLRLAPEVEHSIQLQTEEKREHSPEKAYLRCESHDYWLQRVNELPLRQKQVIFHVFYLGMTLEQTANLLKISNGSARTHYHRGIAKFRTEDKKAA